MRAKGDVVGGKRRRKMPYLASSGLKVLSEKDVHFAQTGRLFLISLSTEPSVIILENSDWLGKPQIRQRASNLRTLKRTSLSYFRILSPVAQLTQRFPWNTAATYHTYPRLHRSIFEDHGHGYMTSFLANATTWHWAVSPDHHEIHVTTDRNMMRAQPRNDRYDCSPQSPIIAR